ncbi:hypothetical protein K443DRAFT_274949 [Laccaria amethystina LaAM-08-1]|uniref:Uncharacterized protein n=1 Tax=Laccaria amethystina LaAM-08-1 TaxID=1095629 RepID=A0A0C9X5V5_9AGAR|nr:hypothetical protein K443DRAFT_274949 [Laccaria amethystina LaAM-08-1]
MLKAAHENIGDYHPTEDQGRQLSITASRTTTIHFHSKQSLLIRAVSNDTSTYFMTSITMLLSVPYSLPPPSSF